MSYYAIGIGGTGARCLEALIHLSAAGLMPDQERLELVLIDVDTGNGNITRTRETLKSYRKCRSECSIKSNFLKNEISLFEDKEVWSPNKDDQTVGDLIEFSTLNPELNKLFQTLFPVKEIKSPLKKRSHKVSSIGATIIAKSVLLDSEDVWKNLKNQIDVEVKNGKTAKILIFGSCFGRTGGTVFPIIARLFHNWTSDFPAQTVQIGGVLMLPYFSFIKNSKTANDNLSDYTSEDFILNTKVALKYYRQQEFHKILNVMYLLGCSDGRILPDFQPGGRSQKNPSHWLELCAALAAVDFYQRKPLDFADKKATGDYAYKLLSRKEKGKLKWSDLPDSVNVKRKLMHLARFSFAFLSKYHPFLKTVNTESSITPWYVKFFEFKNITIDTPLLNELEDLEEYCKDFLRWFANIQFSVTGDLNDKDLIDYSSFASVSEDKEVKLIGSFKELDFDYIPLDKAKSPTHQKLWSNLNEEKIPYGKAQNSWSFIDALYRQCGTKQNF